MLGTDRRIVGIAPDVRFQTLRQQPEPVVYGLDEDQKVWKYTLKGALVFYFVGCWVRPTRRLLRNVGLIRER